MPRTRDLHKTGTGYKTSAKQLGEKLGTDGVIIHKWIFMRQIIFDHFAKHVLLAITEVIRLFLVVGHRFAHISGGVLSHFSSLQILSESLRFRG